jgi:phage shock protein PspC (stress-responsive transcriptional regulator)
MGVADELPQLREGYLLDYDMRTWEVTQHTAYDDPGWPADEWTLEADGDVLILEHEYDDGDVFRLYRPADITDVSVDGEPFLSAVRGDEAPHTLAYQGEEYVLAEEDARVATTRNETLTRSRTDSKLMGVCAGIAEYLDQSPSLVRVAFVAAVLAPAVVPFDTSCLLGPGAVVVYALLAFAISKEPPPSPEDDLVHYWVYEGEERFVAFECTDSNDWDAYAGRQVEPYEFDNILPRGDS